MFTGLVTHIGKIAAISGEGDLRLRVAAPAAVAEAPLGASIACDGVCLTVVAAAVQGDSSWFDVDVSAETLSKTTVGEWRVGRAVNLERALRLGDELGGHIVTGHVDGVGVVAELEPVGDSRRLAFQAPQALSGLIAKKGSITVDGVSLTVNAAAGARFEVNVIPHTLSATTLGAAVVGGRVNLEIDVLARYVASLEAARRGEGWEEGREEK